MCIWHSQKHPLKQFSPKMTKIVNKCQNALENVENWQFFPCFFSPGFRFCSFFCNFDWINPTQWTHLDHFWKFLKPFWGGQGVVQTSPDQGIKTAILGAAGSFWSGAMKLCHCLFAMCLGDVCVSFLSVFTWFVMAGCVICDYFKKNHSFKKIAFS